jgi:hypothetical protein
MVDAQLEAILASNSQARLSSHPIPHSPSSSPLSAVVGESDVSTADAV